MSIENIKKLREATGLGMNDCKEALQQSENNLEKAVEYLRKKGLAKAAKIADRDAYNGLVAFAQNESCAAMILLACETDFVANTDKFANLAKDLAEKASKAENPTDIIETEKELVLENAGSIRENIGLKRVEFFKKDADTKVAYYIHSSKFADTGLKACMVLYSGDNADLARDIAMHATALRTDYLSGEDVPAELLAKEKEILLEKLQSEQKPANIIENILKAGVEKVKTDLALLKQKFFKDDSKTVEQVCSEGKIQILGFARLEI